MHFFQFELNSLLPTALQILKIFILYPTAYLPIIGAWIFTAIYFAVHAGENPGHTYALSTGIALVFTGVNVLLGGVASYKVPFGTVKYFLVIGTAVVGGILIIVSMIKAIPDIIADIVGDPSFLVIPTLLILFFIDGGVAITINLLIILVIPVMLLLGIRLLRKITGAG